MFKYERLTSEEQVKDLIQWHNENLQIPLVLDTEASSKDPRKAELIDIQINGPVYPVIFGANYVEHLSALQSKRFVAHHTGYDIHVLLRSGVDVRGGDWRDTIVLGHLLDENRESYSLDSYVKEYWNDNYKEEFWGKYRSYQEAPQDERGLYACKDIYYTQLLYNKHQEDLWVQGIPDSLVRLVHELQRHLLNTQIQGIDVDLNYLTVKGVELKTRINQLLPEMRKLVETECQLWEMEDYERQLEKRKTEKGKAGVKRPEFSFDSSKQLQSLLYGMLALPEQRNEKTKAVSADEAALERLRESHPLIPKLLEYRGHQKIYTAFIEGTESRIDGGKIYPTFRVTGTATGRLSHSNPNLAQLPKAGGIRGIYVPPPGCVFLSADFAQLEVVVEANLTGDPNTVRIVTEGLSKHDITAQGLGIDRNTAKTLNFAMGYMCTHFKVAKILNVGLEEALEIWKKYWDTYSGCKALKIETDRKVDAGEHIVTLYGRRRRFEMKKRSPFDGDYRAAYNFLMQSTGSDITSEAFVLISDKIQKEKWGPGLGFTLHDEPIVAVYREAAKEAEEYMLEAMAGVGKRLGFKIPLKAQGSGPMDRWEG